MDYLGIGDNKTHRSPEQMSIASQGKAMKALLNKIKRSNLIIYGHSFGTTVATVVASSYRNEKKNANPTIRGVVLEGIVGPGLGNVYGPEFLLTASKTWGLLSDTEKISFQSTAD
jgi:pimeloyl-ACP methyl ester carboxylesterase